jgi:hypothetical protein
VDVEPVADANEHRRYDDRHTVEDGRDMADECFVEDPLERRTVVPRAIGETLDARALARRSVQNNVTGRL